MQKKEREGSFESYALQYHVLDAVSGATFFQKKYILIKVQLQGESKNYLSKFFYSNFV